MGDEQPTSRKQELVTTRGACGPKGTPITTKHVYPPIPIRTYDWAAWYGEWEGDPDDSRPDIGWGSTEELAIADLIDNYDEPEKV